MSLSQRLLHRADLVALAALCAGAFLLYAALDSRYVLDSDVINLALSIERFELAEQQPHAPGYLGYVAVLRAVHALVRMAPVEVAKLTSRLFALATLVATFGAARRLAPASRGTALWAAGLAAASPVLLYYGVDGQTHSAEAAVSAALIFLLAGDREDTMHAVWLGLIVAAGGSLRPTFVLFAIGPVLWRLWRKPRALALVGGVAALGTAAWLGPTLVLAGGWARYRLEMGSLIGAFARITSPLSPGHDPRAVARNLRDVGAWTLFACAPAILAWSVSPVHAPPHPARSLAARLWLAMALPALAFCALVFCGEAGYLAGLVPPAVLYAALSVDALSRPLGRALAAALLAAELALFFMVPAPLAHTTMAPTLAEIVRRQSRTQLLYDLVHERTSPGERVLVLSDFGDLTTVLRQFPLLRPETDCLFIHSGRHSLFRQTTLSLARAHGWRGVPGSVLLADGPETTLESPVAYDWIVIDPRSSDDLWQTLATESECPLPPRDPARASAPHLRAPACFPQRRLFLDRYTVRFGVAERRQLE